MQSSLIEYDEFTSKINTQPDLKIDIINQNYEFFIGKALVQIFAPLKVYDNTNDMSPIIKVTYNNKSFLFAGDIQSESEEDMIVEYGSKLDADVLKVAHHGSSTSTSDEFVQLVNPKYAVICVGYNTYGHPSFDVVANLQDLGAEVLTTQSESVRIVCGIEKFGVLHNKIHSYEFIDWWIIALAINITLVVFLVKNIFILVKLNKNN